MMSSTEHLFCVRTLAAGGLCHPGRPDGESQATAGPDRRAVNLAGSRGTHSSWQSCGPSPAPANVARVRRMLTGASPGNCRYGW
jgi:hypothetical protein